MTTAPSTLRHGSISELTAMLQSQSTMKHDFVAPARALRIEDGELTTQEDSTEISLFGVTTVKARREYVLSPVAASGLASKLDIPIAYWRRMASLKPHLLDVNANEWLGDDDRSFFVRTFVDPDSNAAGYCRAVLSDRYGTMDNLDVLLAALDGVRQTGIDLSLAAIQADLTERKMHVRITTPEVSLNVGHLLDRYRDPRNADRTGKALPLMWAGLVITNSEVGDGAFTVAPRAVLQVCTNGMTRQQDLVRAVHVGSRMDTGVVQWSDETERRNLDLVVSRTRDAVSTFLSTEFLQRYVSDMERAAGVEVSRPEATITAVAKQLRYSEAQAEGILSHFIRGADTSCLGVAHAVTSLAQEIVDADTAADMEADFFRAAELALAMH